MTRYLQSLAIILFAAAPIAGAAAQSAPDKSQFADQALKSCNYDLDHDHFGNYATVDDCVAERSEKLAKDYQAKVAAAQPRKPN